MRDQLLAELNKLTTRVAELRSAETVDPAELTDAIIRVDAVRSEIAAFDAVAPTTNIPAAPAAVETFGRAAAALRQRLARRPARLWRARLRPRQRLGARHLPRRVLGRSALPE